MPPTQPNDLIWIRTVLFLMSFLLFSLMLAIEHSDSKLGHSLQFDGVLIYIKYALKCF